MVLCGVTEVLVQMQLTADCNNWNLQYTARLCYKPHALHVACHVVHAMQYHHGTYFTCIGWSPPATLRCLVVEIALHKCNWVVRDLLLSLANMSLTVSEAVRSPSERLRDCMVIMHPVQSSVD